MFIEVLCPVDSKSFQFYTNLVCLVDPKSQKIFCLCMHFRNSLLRTFQNPLQAKKCSLISKIIRVCIAENPQNFHSSIKCEKKREQGISQFSKLRREGMRCFAVEWIFHLGSQSRLKKIDNFTILFLLLPVMCTLYERFNVQLFLWQHFDDVLDEVGVTKQIFEWKKVKVMGSKKKKFVVYREHIIRRIKVRWNQISHNERREIQE